MTTTTELTTTFQNETLEKSIQILRELETRKVDIVTPIQGMRMTPNGYVMIDGYTTEKGGEDILMIKPNRVAHHQIAEKLKIPYKYWMRMYENNTYLAATNFNEWIAYELEEKGELKTRRLYVRSYTDESGGTLGVMRALLGGSYLSVDNLPTLISTLSAVKEISDRDNLDILVDRLDLTDKKLYVRFVVPSIEAESTEALRNYRDPNGGSTGGLGTSNGIVTGFVISNSETGQAKFNLAPRIRFLACNNGMIWADEAYTRKHVGTRMEEGTYRADTIRSGEETVRKQVRDHVTRFLDPEFLGQRVADIEEMAARKILNPVQCCRNMAVLTGMSEAQTDGILDHFVRQGDVSSVFSVAQAFTSYAQETDPETRYELESAATGLLSMSNRCDTAEVLKK